MKAPQVFIQGECMIINVVFVLCHLSTSKPPFSKSIDFWALAVFQDGRLGHLGCPSRPDIGAL